jgi:hypothetical protein
MAKRRLAMMAGLALLALTRPAAAEDAVALCAAETSRFERTYAIPERLLESVSMVESGRWSKERGKVMAWPWTINAGGQGRFFATKAEAVEAVRRLRAQGTRNIDVGCMQVNLMWHPDAFASLEEAFDPAVNVAYAARFLKGLYEATGHWPTAASYYHSQTPALAKEYLGRLMAVWTGEGARTLLAAAPPATRRTAQEASRQRPEARSRVATLRRIEGLPPIVARPPGSPAIEEMRATWQRQRQANHEAAQRILDAYRLARATEARLRETQAN